MSLGTRILARLAALKMSQAELCRRADIPQSTLNSILRRDTRTSPHLLKMVNVLKTTPQYLSGETDNPGADYLPSELSEDEHKLIDLLRSLNPEKRSAIAEIARLMADG